MEDVQDVAQIKKLRQQEAQAKAEALIRKAKLRWRIAQDKLSLKPRRAQIYVVGFGALVIGLAITTVWHSLSRAMLPGALFLSAALCADVYRVVSLALDTRIGKLCAALIVATIVPTSAGVAASAINDATLLDPSNFPRAVAAITPLAGIYFIVATSVIFAVLASGFAIIAFMVGVIIRQKHPLADGFTLASRIGAVLCLLSILDAGNRNIAPGLYDSLKWFGSRAAYVLDMYPKGECVNSRDARMHRIDEQFAAVASAGRKEIVFKIRRCPITVRSG